MGHPVVPDQIRAEWAAWAIELEGLCDKLTVAAKRAYARDQAEVKQLTAELDAYKARDDQMGLGAGTPATGGWNPAKRALARHHLAAAGRLPPDFNGKASHVAGDSGE